MTKRHRKKNIARIKIQYLQYLKFNQMDWFPREFISPAQITG